MSNRLLGVPKKNGRRPLWVALACVAVAGAAALVLPGCGGTDTAVLPRRITYQDRAGQFALAAPLGKELKHPLQFLVEGAPAGQPDAPARWPAEGTPVTFRITFVNAAGESSPWTGIEPVQADAGGIVRLNFTLGDEPGVYKVSAAIHHASAPPEAEAAEVTILAGMIVENADQDTWSKRNLPEPIVVKFETAPGVYAERGTLLANMEDGSPAKSSLGRDLLAIQPDSREAELMVYGGEGQGPGAFSLVASDSPMGAMAANYKVRVPFFTINAYALAAAVIGGLALFIYGMKRMSEGLQFIAGDKLRQILHWLTANRFAALGVGVVVTAAVQSSSATSVMVVGFVNAGLMSLTQAISVLIGANIGTTITAQIIAFKLDDIALPAVAIGMVLSSLAKSSKVKMGGMILVGFGLLFLGLTIMGDSLKELKDSQYVRSLFDALDSRPDAAGQLHVWPVMKGVFVGIVVTMVVQSSSVTTGLLIMLAGAGLMNAYTAYAVLLGENIGTTVTAILASMGASRAAMRAALFHVLFNTFGVVGMVILHFVSWPGTDHPIFMQLVAEFTNGDPFAGENLPRYLANAHTMFNIVVAAAFMFLIRPMAALCVRMIPETPEELAKRRQRLEPHFLATPSLAMQQVWTQMGLALEQSHEAITDAHRALGDPSDPNWDALAESVRNHERDTDEFQVEVTEFLGHLSLVPLNEHQAEALPRMLHGVNDIERIGDYGRHMIKLASRARKRNLPFTPEARAEILQMVSGLEEMFALAAESVRLCAGDRPPHEARRLMREVEETTRAIHRIIKKHSSEFRKAHEIRHENGECDIRSGVVFLDVVNTLARVGGHLANIVDASAAGL